MSKKNKNKKIYIVDLFIMKNNKIMKAGIYQLLKV